MAGKQAAHVIVMLLWTSCAIGSHTSGYEVYCFGGEVMVGIITGLYKDASFFLRSLEASAANEKKDRQKIRLKTVQTIAAAAITRPELVYLVFLCFHMLLVIQNRFSNPADPPQRS